MPEILLIALSLAMDAMAVSISASIACPQGGVKQALRLGIWFGAFQFAMPLVGFFLGQTLLGYVSTLAPWIAFALLAFIGGKMLWDNMTDGGEEKIDANGLTNRKLCLLAVATSIDALATGVSAAFMSMPLWISCGVIGVVAFVLSVVGALAGNYLGERFQRFAGLLGGIVLIGIGVKFLLQSL